MKSFKSLLCLILSLLLSLSLFSCSAPAEDDIDDDDVDIEEEENEEDNEDEEDIDEDTSEDEDEDEDKNEDEDEQEETASKSYTVNATFEYDDAVFVMENNSIQHKYLPFELSIVTVDDMVYLVDYSGNISVALENEDNYIFSYCPVGSIITDHSTKINPLTLEVSEHFAGHGWSSTNYYYYDTETGTLFSEVLWGYGDVANNVKGAVVVREVVGRPATEDEQMYLGDSLYYELTDNYGVVKDGNLIIPCEFENAQPYSSGLCALSRDGLWGYFDENGKQVYSFQFTEVAPPSESNLIPLCQDGMWAYGTTDGRIITDFEFESATCANLGRAWVKQDGKWMSVTFNKFCQTISLIDAEQAVYDHLMGVGHVSIDITKLSDEDSFTFYLSEGYCFTTESLDSTGNKRSYTYFVFKNGSLVTVATY